MQNIRPTVPWIRRTPGLVGVVSVLLLHLVTATPIAPLTVALVARLDHSHRVALQQTAQGLQVVLRHGCVDSPSHRHGLIAQALTAFARRSTAPQTDHIIQFVSPDIAEQTLAFTTEPASDASGPNEEGVAGFRFHAVALTVGRADTPRPPPVESELLLTVRSTVLLI